MLTTQHISLHTVGLADAMQVGQKLFPERMPKQAILVGVEGKEFHIISAQLSPGVAEGIDAAVAKVLELCGVAPNA